LITGADPHNFISGHTGKNDQRYEHIFCITPFHNLSLFLSRAEPPMAVRLRQVSQFYSPQTNIVCGQSVPRPSYQKKLFVLGLRPVVTWVLTIDWVCLRICNTRCFLAARNLSAELMIKLSAFCVFLRGHDRDKPGYILCCSCSRDWQGSSEGAYQGCAWNRQMRSDLRWRRSRRREGETEVQECIGS
jgi:hypothetical protein